MLQSLDAQLRAPGVRAAIEPIVARVQRALEADRAACMAWEPIPLATYGALPPDIRSSWVFILRAGATTGAERHPNSRQRMVSWRGRGDFQTGGEGRWESHELVSDVGAPLESRWISIPVNEWHQAVVPGADWAVVSFQTAGVTELVEERMDPAGTGTQRKRYVAG